MENGNTFNIRNPNEIYSQSFGEGECNEKEFVEEFSKVGGLEKALVAIRQDPENPDAYRFAGGIIHNNENFYYQIKESPRPVLEEIVPERKKGIEKYVSKNEEPILNSLGSEEYKNLIMVVPLPKIKEDGEYKTIVDVISEFKVVQEAAEDPQKRVEYLSSKMKGAPKYVQNEFARYSSNEAFVKQMFAHYASYAGQNAQEVIEKGDCEGVFKIGLKEAKNKTLYHDAMASALYQKATSKKK